MIPTFDFANILQRIYNAIISTIANPVVIMQVALAGISAAAAIYVGWFAELSIPSISLMEIEIDNTDFAQLIAYCIDYQTLSDIWDFVARIVVSSITMLLTFGGLLLVAYWVFNTYLAIRRSLREVGGAS